jgi:dTDP-L-rhamnose 4-epimerase
LILASSRAVYGEGPYLDSGRGEVVFPPARRKPGLPAAGWEAMLPGRGPLQPLAASEAMPCHPASVYAATKVAQERHCRTFAARHGVATIALRLQNVYGPGQDGLNPQAGLVAALARGVLQHHRIELFEDGAMTRDFIHIDDVVRAMRWSLEARLPLPPVANVGTGWRTPLRQVAELLAGAAGVPLTVSCSGRFRAGDIRHACADTTLWRAWCGTWEPVTLDAALPAYVQWLTDAKAASACR